MLFCWRWSRCILDVWWRLETALLYSSLWTLFHEKLVVKDLTCQWNIYLRVPSYIICAISGLNSNAFLYRWKIKNTAGFSLSNVYGFWDDSLLCGKSIVVYWLIIVTTSPPLKYYSYQATASYKSKLHVASRANIVDETHTGYLNLMSSCYKLLWLIDCTDLVTSSRSVCMTAWTFGLTGFTFWYGSVQDREKLCGSFSALSTKNIPANCFESSSLTFWHV